MPDVAMAVVHDDHERTKHRLQGCASPAERCPVPPAMPQGASHAAV